MRGPPPKPTSLKLLNGLAGKKPLPESEPITPEISSDPPPWLDEESRVFWSELIEIVRMMQVAQVSDRYALSMLAMCIAEVKNAAQRMNEEGRTMMFESGAQQVSPYFSIFSKAMGQAMKIMAEFGMTPAARTRVRAMAAQEENNDFAEFLGRGGSKSS